MICYLNNAKYSYEHAKYKFVNSFSLYLKRKKKLNIQNFLESKFPEI